MNDEKEQFDSHDPAMDLVSGSDHELLPEYLCEEIGAWIDLELEALEDHFCSFVTAASLKSTLKRGR